MTMTSEAKGQLSKTIRALRARLLTELSEATDREYRFSMRSPNLDAAKTIKRKRLEDWLDEQVRGETGKQQRTLDDFRSEAELQAAYTLLNRLVILRIMEATGLRKPLVVTGGWNSQGYKDFRELAPALVRGDKSEGFSFLLQLIFEDLAIDLPGLYGSVGIADLIPVPSTTIRAVVEAFDDPQLESCWTDDMTLGWVYQYWNDPQREVLDEKLNARGKLEPHEIASKTQMFTERYMVDWLLQNSLGPMWLAMCQKHGWTPEVEADGTLRRLEDRRVAWRAKRDAGEVQLTDLMPLATDAERRWAYFVPQPIPDDAIENASDSVRDLKILDPAVGSGHFLVVAFDLLIALYKEEARHRGESSDERWSDIAIVERILEHNLYGIDLDPRAVQIAAATLWLKAQLVCTEAHPRQLNLVASNLGIASLPDDDPALVELRRAVEEETGIPAHLTNQIVEALRGADHLGSLLKVDAAIEAAIAEHEGSLNWEKSVSQMLLFPDDSIEQRPLPFPKERIQFNFISALELFLSHHTSAQELGLRLRGEQLAAGVRFVRLVREGAYDLVVANPPYQGTAKMADAKYVGKHYKLGKADLFAAFLLRGLDLVHEHGVSAMLTMRNWMFIKQFAEYRKYVLTKHTLSAIGDVSWGAFREMRDNPVTISVFRRGKSTNGVDAIAMAPTDPQERVRTQEAFAMKGSGMLCHVGRTAFDPAALKVVPEWPLVYWWDKVILDEYKSKPLLETASPACAAQSTSGNKRFLAFWWEVPLQRIDAVRTTSPTVFSGRYWRPCVNGSEDREWFEPLYEVVRWSHDGLQLRVKKQATGQGSGKLASDGFFFKPGVAIAMIGNRFSARAHRYRSYFADKGTSLFPNDIGATLCLLNSSKARFILQSLNPSISFQAGDVNRLPLVEIPDSHHIWRQLLDQISVHESHREASFEYKQPGPSPWKNAQKWAQLSVDRPEGAPLPEYVEQLDPEPQTDHVSFGVGVALGRFGGNGEGIFDPSSDNLSHALPHGVLFLNGSLADEDRSDSLGDKAAEIIHDKWTEHGPHTDRKRSLRDWLRERFFPDVHKGMYENRPIHWPLSSAKKTFVAWVTIHRWNDQTLRILLADHLEPALKRLDGEIVDVTAARGSGDKKQARAAEDRYNDVKAWRDELSEFIAHVQQCAEQGPAPPDPKKPEREADARYIPDLDDGVMINSAALWPLLDPQWKNPKTWWDQLVLADPRGNRDLDWSHLAMRYWPTRVDQKCQTDPSLGVAHGCFWKYHPAKAWAWELRLQDEIAPDFRIEEAPYRGDGGDVEHRAAYLRDHTKEALAIIEKEVLRRLRKQKQKELSLLETGLWSAIPEECWDLENKLTKKQEVEFRLLAPDEPEARGKFEKSHPGKVKSRKALLSKLRPPDLFAVLDGEDNQSKSEDVQGPEIEEVDA